VPESELPGGSRRLPIDRLAGCCVEVAGDLDDAERRIEPAYLTELEQGRLHGEGDRTAVGLGDDDRFVRTRDGSRREPVHLAPPGADPSWRGGPPKEREDDRGATAVLRAERGGQQPVECGGVDDGRPLCLEKQRDGRAPVGHQSIPPPELVERCVERLVAARLGGAADAASEELKLGRFHQRSSPSPSNLRAMMLRWISALPP
jgi:hypothetical protein